MDPSVAPDGRIAFISTRDNVSGEIYVMNHDGSDQTRLTNNSGSSRTRRGRPENDLIAFASYPDRHLASLDDGARRLRPGPGPELGGWRPQPGVLARRRSARFLRGVPSTARATRSRCDVPRRQRQDAADGHAPSTRRIRAGPATAPRSCSRTRDNASDLQSVIEDVDVATGGRTTLTAAGATLRRLGSELARRPPVRGATRRWGGRDAVAAKDRSRTSSGVTSTPSLSTSAGMSRSSASPVVIWSNSDGPTSTRRVRRSRTMTRHRGLRRSRGIRGRPLLQCG